MLIRVLFTGVIDTYGGFRNANHFHAVHGQTVLYIACSFGDFNMTKKLLELGADPNKYCRSLDNMYDYFARTRTPLIVACLNERVECIDLLIADSRTDLNLIDKELNKTALQVLQDKFPHLISVYLEFVKKRGAPSNKV